MHASNKPVSEDEKADDVFSRRHLYCGTPVVTSWAVAGQQVVFLHMYLQTWVTLRAFPVATPRGHSSISHGGEHRFNPRDMKHRVNSIKSRRELEPDRHRINHLGDVVRLNESGHQLTGRHPERQILGRKPYSLTTHIRWSRGPAMIGFYLGLSWGSDKNPTDFLPGVAAALNESQGRQNHNIGSLWWKKRWFITH